jgi:serine/threonine protein phosphatase PrpC
MGHGGKCVPLSFDHKPENPVEIDRIYKAGSTITDGRVDGNLNLTRALGDLKYKQQSHLKPEEHPVTANPDIFEYDMPDDLDFVIMGCDGVWEQKSNEEMVAWVYKKLGNNCYNAKLSDTVTDLLKNECLSADHVQTSGIGCDNMTCILIVFGR